MSRINTNVTALIGARILNANNTALNRSLERLSTGLRINRGSDDPAGLIASENLRAQKSGTENAIANAQRANNMIGTAEGALNEVSAMLVELQGLVSQSANEAGLSQEEIEANQLQIDSILSTINRISNTTTFEGVQLLNGNFDYTTSSVSSSDVSYLRVNSAKLAEGQTMSVVVDVTTSAQFAKLKFTGAGLASDNNVTLSITGNYGTEILTFAGSSTISEMATAINEVTDLTGVSATTSGTGALYFNSVGYGSDAFVTVTAVSGSFSTTGDGGASATTDTGVDAAATINGVSATADGLDLSVRTGTLDVELTLSTTNFNQATGSFTFGITGGGADFAFGPTVTQQGKASIGIQSISTASLGTSTLGYLSSLSSGSANDLSSGNYITAQRIVSEAIKQVSSLRGRLGAFQRNVIGSTVNSLNIALENAMAAESAIRDTDFATETAALTRAQILVQAGASILSLANAQPQAVLSLLK